MVRGIWARAAPTARGSTEASRQSPDAASGKLYPGPSPRCKCGGRVLELLYCYECGDVSLGGYVARELDAQATPAIGTSAPTCRTSPTSSVSASTGAVWGSYMWLWPGKAPTGVKPWNHTVRKSQSGAFNFLPADFVPRMGLPLQAPACGDEDWTDAQRFVDEARSRASDLPSLPERCPRCLSRRSEP